MKSYSKNLKQKRSGWFPLAEVIMGVIFMGVGLAAVMEASRFGTQVNACAASDVPQEMFLAHPGLCEGSSHLPSSDTDQKHQERQEPKENQKNPSGTDNPPLGSADDPDDYNHQTFSPPASSKGDSIKDMSGSEWSQTADISWNNDKDNAAGNRDAAYMRVTIRHHGQVVLKTGWTVSQQPEN